MNRLTLIVAALALVAPAATLEKLTLDDMVAKSADIVRGKVTAASASFRGAPGRGGMIYTHYIIQVSERFKGSSTGATADVAVPGGTALGFRQTFAGAPSLNVGEEYVFFLWTSRSGLTQIIGLTQGLFTLKVDASGKPLLARSAISEVMLDPATGTPVSDSGMKLTVSELRQRVANLAGAKADK
jgi:hypothetical protein